MLDKLSVFKNINENFSVATIVWAKPGSEVKIGDKLFFTSSKKIYGDFGSSTNFILKNLQQSLKDGSSFLVSYTSCDTKDDATCGTKYQAFIEYYGDFPKIHIFGAGDIGKFTHNTLLLMDFDSILYDSDPELLNGIKNTRLIDYKNINFTFSVKDYFVIVTRGHKNDYDMLKFVFDLNEKPKYVGLLGSKTKNDILKDKLFEQGYTIKYWEIIKTPIGLNILNAKAPKEIALAIVAEIIAIKNGGDL